MGWGGRVGAREGEWRLCGRPSLIFVHFFAVAWPPDGLVRAGLGLLSLSASVDVHTPVQHPWFVFHNGAWSTDAPKHSAVVSASSPTPRTNMSCTATAKRQCLHRAQRAGRLPSAEGCGVGHAARGSVGKSTIRRRHLSAKVSAPTRESSRLGSRLSAPGGDSDDSGGLVALGRKTSPCPCCVPVSTTIRSRSRTCQV